MNGDIPVSFGNTVQYGCDSRRTGACSASLCNAGAAFPYAEMKFIGADGFHKFDIDAFRKSRVFFNDGTERCKRRLINIRNRKNNMGFPIDTAVPESSVSPKTKVSSIVRSSSLPSIGGSFGEARFAHIDGDFTHNPVVLCNVCFH